jgi:ubiquinone/menaquinone biosynthesis C-methylase UbiE
MSRREQLQALYEGRKLSEGYPGLERMGVEIQSHNQGTQTDLLYTPAFMQCVANLIDLNRGLKTVLVTGCGPRPFAVKWLLEQGYDASGLEPVEPSVESARGFLGDTSRVHLGGAESMPLADGSQRVILMESVLEHVDSPEKTLAECFRVLSPGGVLFIYTTNRWKITLTGYNGEYQVPFFNWFPNSVKESYVFHHLHYDPKLAQYNARPAFHWFSYSELCRLGRSAGFGHFYSLLDVANLDNPLVANSRLRRFLLNRVRYNPWLRGLALTQMGGSSIFMLKRAS